MATRKKVKEIGGTAIWSGDYTKKSVEEKALRLFGFALLACFVAWVVYAVTI